MSKKESLESLLLPLAFAIFTIAGLSSATIGGVMLYFKIATSKLQVLGIIPAKGKSLESIKIAWENARRTSTLNHVVVATDDKKIADACRSFGADIIIISESCKNGIKCCIEAIHKKGTYNIVVNIPGDVEPKIIDDFLDDEKEFFVKKRDKGAPRDLMTCVDLKLVGDRGYEKVLKDFSLDDILRSSH